MVFIVTAEKQRDVQRAGVGGRGLGPDERGVLQDSDGRHRGAPGGGGGTGVNSWEQGKVKPASTWNFAEEETFECYSAGEERGPEYDLVSEVLRIDY